MARTLTPLPLTTDPAQLRQAFNERLEELNLILAELDEERKQTRGNDGYTAAFTSTIDLGGHHICNAAESLHDHDYITRAEARKNALYARPGATHRAHSRIVAEHSITVPTALRSEDALPLGQAGSMMSGFVKGPDTSTDNAVARWDGTNGRLLQDSGVTIDDMNNVLIPGNLELDAALNHDGTTAGFYGTTPVTQAAASANLTDNTGGTANDTVQALTDPADAPATADALRDDLVANLIPELRNNFADLTAKLNTALTVLRNVGLMAT